MKNNKRQVLKIIHHNDAGSLMIVTIPFPINSMSVVEEEFEEGCLLRALEEK